MKVGAVRGAWIQRSYHIIYGHRALETPFLIISENPKN